MADGFPRQLRAQSLLCASGKKKKKSNWERRLHRAAPLSCAGEPRQGSIFRRRAGGEKKRSPVAFNVGGRSLMREAHLESRHTSAQTGVRTGASWGKPTSSHDTQVPTGSNRGRYRPSPTRWPKLYHTSAFHCQRWLTGWALSCRPERSMWDLRRDVRCNFYSRLHFGWRWLLVVFKCHWRFCFLRMSGSKTHLEEVESPKSSCKEIIRMWQVAFWRPEGRTSVLTSRIMPAV